MTKNDTISPQLHLVKYYRIISFKKSKRWNWKWFPVYQLRIYSISRLSSPALRTTEECHISTGPAVLLGNTVQPVMKGFKEARAKREKSFLSCYRVCREENTTRLDHPRGPVENQAAETGGYPLGSVCNQAAAADWQTLMWCRKRQNTRVFPRCVIQFQLSDPPNKSLGTTRCVAIISRVSLKQTLDILEK